MSYRRPLFRRALALALALAVGPASLVVAGSAAQGVADPKSTVVPLPNPADSIAFDDGRLLSNIGINGTRRTQVDKITVPLDDWIVVTSNTATYLSTASSNGDHPTIATSAGVDVISLVSTGRVQVRRGSSILVNVKAPTGSTWSVDISGPYARIGRNVYDIRRGSTPIYALPTSTTSAALHGSQLVWSESDGTVRLRDVSTFKPPTTVRAGTKACTTCGQKVAINSTTAVYGVPGGQLGLWDIAAGKGQANALLLTGVERFRLGDGFLVTMMADGLVLYRLNDPLSLSTPNPYLTGVHVVDLATDGHAFAILRADGSVMVSHLPDSVDGQRRPTVLAGSLPGAFSPNGDKVADAWLPSFVLTRPVTTWRLDVVSPSNSLVARFVPAAGAQPTASISAAWKPGKGRAQGAYSWTLTGTGSDGALMRANGSAVTGVVNLRRTNDRTSTIKAPANVATAGRSARTPLSWRPAGGFPSGVSVASYDVQYRTVRISKKKRSYGTVKNLLVRTKKSSTTFKGTRGATYQFRSRNRDNVGLVGPWTAWRVSNTPLDDRSRGVKYSKGWKSVKTAGRWDGTQHWTKQNKRTVSVSKRGTSGFALVMRTCSTCGSVKVYVDGKLRRTVDLSSSSTLRREVYSINFKKLGRHSIKVVTVVKGKKKLVALDAILVRH